MQGLVPGLTLTNRFHLIRQLGVGGMGEIWLADDEQLSERVALKLLNPSLDDPERFVELLRDECRKTRGLLHPNIVRVHDFHVDDQLFFISMQYVEGTTLAALKGKSFQEIVRCLLMVCDALEYAHRAGIVHRDLKPSNVLVDNNGICYLTDFGVAAALADDHRLLQIRAGGSPPSMSPQQLSGEPTTIADDIYSLGALLYELLSGQPLFHPGITEERIRNERPQAPNTDGESQPIPESLRKVILAMLEKTPGRRPAGVGAVRLVLEEVAADYPAPTVQSDDAQERNDQETDVIRPIRRRARAAAVRTAEVTVPTATTKPETQQGLPAKLVYGGLGALLLVALGVVFLLPAVVNERGPVVIERNADDADAAVENPEDAGPDPAVLAAQRADVDQLLGELLEIDERLKSIGVELWGGADWVESRRAVDNGDQAYKGREYVTAGENYQRALTLMKLIEPRAPEVLEDALREGQAALDTGDQSAAIENFELALAIDDESLAAQKGLERARNLDQVVELMSRAIALEDSGNLAGARSAYTLVLDLDELWQPAKDALARINSRIARSEYEQRMAAGFNQMAQENFVQARAAFSSALAVRPGDAEAAAALRQLDAEERLRDIAALRQTAIAAEQVENWAIAVEKYSEILAINSQLTEIRDDLERSQQRLELHKQLNYEISRAEQFNEEAIWNAASRLLDRARSIPEAGTVLAGQIDRLQKLLRIASIPVPVEFRSDNLTDVVIYKVGSLGTFLTRTIDLKPGSYVAVGRRDGYRDVRQDFVVEASGNMPPIVLSCEDAI